MSRSQFVSTFGLEPTLVIRSPGRVNLIGEHTDYSLLPVLPMAIDRGITLWAAPADDGLVAAESLQFPGAITFDAAHPPAGSGGWHRYLVAAVAALGHTGAGARLLVGGDLPSTGGLSSSSAFTVGVIATLGRLWGLPFTREDLPGLAIGAERSIGVEGGMMDQTVIALAEAGHALRIDFDPPGRRAVPIPRELAIVAAYSGSPAPKGGDAKQDYNTRVVASRAAALCWGVPAGVEVGAPPVLSRVVAAMTPDPAGLPDRATAQQVADRVGVEVDSMVRLTAERFDPALPLPVRAVGRHIVSEAARVDAAEAALREGRLVELGRLLDASHESLRDFGASSDRLDALVAAMRDAGAWGARLTGAGFGGYAIAACAPERVEDVIGAAQAATGGEPAFRVTASAGVGPITDD